MKRVLALLLVAVCFNAHAERLGEFYVGDTVPVLFTTYDAAGASVTITGLAVTDIEVYKGTSMTQRASDSGYALVDTDGIDVDSTVGVHGFSIDTSDNTTAGFWTAGSAYTVVLNSITVESETVVGLWTFTLKDDDVLTQHALLDSAFLNCEVNTANFAGSTTTLACILMDRDGGAVTVASGDLQGLEIRFMSGAQIYEGRFINSTTWDGANSELRITLSRALPATLADGVTAVIR